MDELEWLKLRLENAIHGHMIALQVYYDDEIKNMLQLLEDCYSVISRIQPVDDDLEVGEK